MIWYIDIRKVKHKFYTTPLQNISFQNVLDCIIGSDNVTFLFLVGNNFKRENTSI